MGKVVAGPGKRLGRPPVDPATRFLAKILVGDGCWEWRGYIAPTGYGQFSPQKDKPVGAHRFAYELFIGPIPDGLVIDHLCRNRGCVRPSHLEAVTTQENLRRGEGFIGENFRKIRCKRGHKFDYVDARGKRICRTCKHEWYVAHKQPEVSV